MLEILVTPLGWLLRRKRAGEQSAYKYYSQFSTPTLFQLSSPAFPDGGEIPNKHAGEGRGENLSPELRWAAPPEGTKQLLLVMEDIDVPLAKPILHLIALFEPTERKLSEGALGPENKKIKFIPGRKGRLGYHGPRALPGHGKHRYWFHLYALDQVIPINGDYSNFEEILPLVDGHVIGRAHLEGTQTGR